MRDRKLTPRERTGCWLLAGSCVLIRAGGTGLLVQLFGLRGYPSPGLLLYDFLRPVLLFLHGAGECGTDLEALYIHGPAPALERIAQFKDHYPFIGLSPQCLPGRRWVRTSAPRIARRWWNGSRQWPASGGRSCR